jgi:peptide/nickel transport system permease protein
MSTVSVALEGAQSSRGTTESAGFLRRLLRRPLAVIYLSYLLLLVGVAIVAPFALPGVGHEPLLWGNFAIVRQGPTWHHLLGGDTLGRDVLYRLLVGTRTTLLGVIYAVVVATAVGVPAGLVAGFLGGWIGGVIGWLTDLGLSFPGLIIVIVAATAFQGSMFAAMCALGLVLAPGVARVVRAATLPLRGESFVMAARVSGLSRPYIVGRELLPRIGGAVIVQGSLAAGTALLIQSGLAFLGLVPLGQRTPSWGGMIADGTTVIYEDPWLIWPPGVVLAMTVVVFVLFGDLARDIVTERWSTPTRPPRRRTSLTARYAPTRPRRRSRLTTRLDAQSQTPLLSVEGLSIGFDLSDGTTSVVEDVNFDINPGETVGLMGESGCGKTITAMSILGLLPGTGRITAGRILFAGHDLAALSDRGLRRIRGRGIGLISQDPMVALTPVYQVGWQVAEVVRRHQQVTRAQARARAIELLGRVHLPDPERVAERYPYELSGGMAQRVCLAAALAGNPRLLIADEPTTALDVTVQAEILDLMRELQRDTGTAVLLITHDGSVVADICDRVVVMYAGQVVERGPILPIFEQPLHPYTQALLHSNPHYFNTARRLPTIPGTVPQPGAWPEGCHFHPRCTYATDACQTQKIPLESAGTERQTRCIHYSALLEGNPAQ